MLYVKGSPSLIRRVLLISFGMTMRLRSSTRRTIPVVVPGIFLAGGAASSSADRCHSLSSLYSPPAALASLPCSFHISSLLLILQITMLVFVRHGDLYALFIDFRSCVKYTWIRTAEWKAQYDLRSETNSNFRSLSGGK